MATSIYRRLTGKRRRFHLYTQLWMAADHLLLVKSNRLSETYQRFFFKDIQALVVTGLPSRTWMQVSFGVLSAAVMLMAITLIPIAGWRALAGLLALIPGVIALADYIGGPRCNMTVKTAVSSEALAAVSRMAAARQVFARLKPVIDQAQSGEWIAESPESAITHPPVLVPAIAAPPPASRLILALFSLVTIDIVVYAAARITVRPELLGLLTSSLITELVIAAAALYRRGQDPRWFSFSLAGVVVACTGLELLGGMGLFGLFIYIASEDQRTGSGNAGRFFKLAYPQFLLWFGTVWRALVAVAGWVSLYISGRPAAPPGPEAPWLGLAKPVAPTAGGGAPSEP